MGSDTGPQAFLRPLRLRDVEGVSALGHRPLARRLQGAAGVHDDVAREVAVGDRRALVNGDLRAVGGVGLQHHRRRAGAEVEHERRAFVLVVDQVPLATGGDEQRRLEVVDEQLRSRLPNRDGRAGTEAVALHRDGVVGAHPRGDVGRQAPDDPDDEVPTSRSTSWSTTRSVATPWAVSGLNCVSSTMISNVGPSSGSIVRVPVVNAVIGSVSYL